jgi:aminoglycoside 6'-N-acetyltransferase I
VTEIRPILPEEHNTWLDLRLLLWPEDTREELQRDQVRFLRDPDVAAVFVAAEPDGELTGFIEASIRPWAEGCSTEPVGYIEGWFVHAEHRRSGIGRRLVDAAEAWAISKGCSEMGSDTELWNDLGRNAHLALGFTEATRLVCFSKRLTNVKPVA